MGNWETSGGWKNSLLAAKTEKLLEPLAFLEDSGKPWYVAEVRKSAEVNTWEVDPYQKQPGNLGDRDT